MFRHKMKLLAIVATVIIAVSLAVLPISNTQQSGMVTVPADMFAGSGNLIPVNRVSSIDEMIDDTSNYINALDTYTLDTLWTGNIPLDIQSNETVANVMLAAGSIDMTSLNSSEEFSFNNIVGLRTEEKGYQSGLMYSNGEVVSGIGGGICIVSTILYNAALETGLKIIERHPHSGPVSYAEPGRDAAVSFGWADLRFKNTTGHPLIMKSKVENNELFVSVFGVKNPDQTITITAKDFEELPYTIREIEDLTIPEGQVVVDQKARPGYVVTIVRSFMENGKLVNREIISKDIMLPQDKVVRITPRPFSIPIDLPMLPGFASDHPETLSPATVDAAPEQKQPDAPKTGSFTVPDDPKPAVKPAQAEPLPDLSGGSTTSPAAGSDGRNLSNSDRTTPTASE
ncbi:MAG: VanW family protein [Armatimonadota bacterium]